MPKVPAFIQAAGFAGRKDKRAIRVLVYITPITHVLAAQVSPEIAALLFHPDGSGKMQPSLVMPTAGFDIGNIPLQRMELHPSADPKLDNLGVLLDRVEISNISARKIFPDDPNFTLSFHVSLPLDKLSVEMAHRYYDEKVFLTFEAMQLSMFGKAKCEYCEDPPVA